MMQIKVDKLMVTDTVNHQATQRRPEPIVLHGRYIGSAQRMSSGIRPWMLKVKPFDPRF